MLRRYAKLGRSSGVTADVEPKRRDCELENWWRPKGALPDWVNCVVVLACAITVAIATVGAHLLWWRAGHGTPLDAFWVRNGVTIGLASWIVVSFVPRWRLSRLLRVAVLLPVAHLVWMIGGWELWSSMASRMPRVAVVAALPMAALLVGGAAWFAIAGKVIARRRGEWIHAVVMMTLLGVLLFGLWLPIASAIWCANMHVWTDWVVLDAALQHPAGVAAFVLAPPLLASVAIAAFVLRHPDRRNLVIAGSIVLGIAMLTRLEPSYGAALVYVNFIHALVALGILAVTALGVLGIATWHRTRRRAFATSYIGDVVFDDNEPVGCIEITSWLRGPVALLRPFVVATAAGDVLVPNGAELAASIPPETTGIRVGESIEVLRRGDRVVLGGYVEPDAHHPFRESSALIPGPHGVVVSRADDDGYGFANAALAMWRPCVAYLLILVAIAIPALLAANAS